MNLYVHYKGALYLRFETAVDSTNDSPYSKADPLVVYYSLERSVLHTRRLSEFHEEVEWPDGERRSRFAIAGTIDQVIKLYRAAGGRV